MQLFSLQYKWRHTRNLQAPPLVNQNGNLRSRLQLYADDTVLLDIFQNCLFLRSKSVRYCPVWLLKKMVCPKGMKSLKNFLKSLLWNNPEQFVKVGGSGSSPPDDYSKFFMVVSLFSWWCHQFRTIVLFFTKLLGSTTVFPQVPLWGWYSEVRRTVSVQSLLIKWHLTGYVDDFNWHRVTIPYVWTSC